MSIIVCGALIRGTMTLPKSCLPGLILSVVAWGACGPITIMITPRDDAGRGSGREFFASGALARSAA
ncbi:MAG TPA: hypothetical protein VNZ26_35360, partial [Vicinamibacterales bacterium]|nr:hypothetical protein [Vicinamibacterales bacterium]